MKFVLLLILIGMVIPVFAQEPNFDDQLVNSTEYSKIMDRFYILENNVDSLEVQNSELNTRIEKLGEENQYLKTYLEDLGIISQQQSSTTQTFNFFELYVGIIIALSGLGVGYATIRFQKKQLQTTTLFKIFELLSNPEARLYRKYIYDEWKLSNENPNFDQTIIDDSSNAASLRKIVDVVQSNFDKVCALVKMGSLDKETFFELYGIMVVKSYNVMRLDMEKKQLKSKKSAIHFYELGDEFDPRVSDEDKKIY